MSTVHTWPRLLTRRKPDTDPDADPELEAIIACLKRIGPLSPAARARVVAYLTERVEEMREYRFED